ncbi:uncharacterized protein K489DRAFT_62867 [Dissoconium aciculare CBS 342.82]|uniref:Large ribosomal subunit protein mL67 n=1 Tax=Dissoconium aciculare CBS 342.82 TaxID=1314786 RepID=A0A6J3LZ99_9PEZI|nr:uncharacterized protein K489DRAFT_62867 [Dissoconium aciculare CBS 342.82]KAF1819962.1 hypothetical protein K489DRAFT_62867 [Dissoconium aciculare CBS 342.82]
MRNLLLKRPKREDVVGRHIYAFVKNRTNQVLYSFSRTLRPQDLKQLPDAGANNTPPSLRKDEWRPLWTVSIPGTPTTSRINQELITKLRDYRMLHELCWEMPESITKPFDEEEIKQMKDKLKRRGGSKKESVYDVIKHKKKKLRAQMVMDQKANSVADLAAGLLQISDQEASDLALEEARQKREEVALLVRLSNDFEETIRDSNEEYLQLKSSVSPEISELGADEPISQDGLEDSMKPEAAGISTKISPELRAAMDEIHAKQARSKYAVEELVRARENLQKQVEDLAGQIKIAEARLDSRSDETDKEKSTNENDAKSDASIETLRMR